jgi:hypothetical protein
MCRHVLKLIGNGREDKEERRGSPDAARDSGNGVRSRPGLERSSLRELPSDDFLQKGNILRKFLGLTRQLETMPEGLVRELLHIPGRGSVPGSTSKR